MSPSTEHERVKSWLRALAEGVLTARGLDYIPGGSTTFRREDLQRGLEPDECYWIANFEAVRHTPDVDLDRDPPPDLVLEIDMVEVPSTDSKCTAAWASRSMALSQDGN